MPCQNSLGQTIDAISVVVQEFALVSDGPVRDDRFECIDPFSIAIAEETDGPIAPKYNPIWPKDIQAMVNQGCQHTGIPA
ncbi:MAG: hypothetical protein NZ744_05535, partial [Pirellulaceae bacterium]|nr:hypothetical protein [Pirellulaceae bacterium]